MIRAPRLVPPYDRSRRRVAHRALAVVLGGVLVATAACSNGDADDKGGEDAKGGTEASAAADPTGEETAAAEPIMLGDQAAVSPCRLLPVEDVESIFGPLGDDGYVEQEVLDRGRTAEEMEEITNTVLGAVRTSCRYSYRDADRRQVQVEALQYATPELAQARWQFIKDSGNGVRSRKAIKNRAPQGLIDLILEQEKESGGTPMKQDPDVLYVKGGRQYVAVQGNVLVTLSDSPSLLEFDPPPFTAKEAARRAPLMVEAFEAVAAHAADPELSQAAAPTTLEDGAEPAPGIPYLDPCAVLDAAAFETTIGRVDDGVVTSTSLPRETVERRARAKQVIEGAPANECERTASWYPKGKEKSAGNLVRADITAEIRYAADELSAMDLMEQHFIRRTFEEKYWDQYTLGQATRAGLMTDVEAEGTTLAYLLETETGFGDTYLLREAFFTVGPYSVLLTGVPRRSGFTLDNKPLSAEQFTTAMTAVAGNIRTLAGLDEG